MNFIVKRRRRSKKDFLRSKKFGHRGYQKARMKAFGEGKHFVLKSKNGEENLGGEIVFWRDETYGSNLKPS